MSIFENCTSLKDKVDDTHPLKCTILNTRNINGFTEYVIEVTRIGTLDCTWKIFKRYSDFVKLQNTLNKLSSKINLDLPPKKFIGNMDRKLVMQRQNALQNSLNIMVENLMLVNSLVVRSFLDPQTYSEYCKEHTGSWNDKDDLNNRIYNVLKLVEIQDSLFQKVGMVLRGNREFELSKELPDIGWRLRRKSFLSKWKKDPKQELLLSWTESGPDLLLKQHDLVLLLKSISSIIHPLIDVPVILPSPEGYVLSVHNIQVGSLRDVLYQTTPLQSFLKKYWDTSSHVYLPDQTLMSYIKQILYGLKFLHDNNIAYGHLHCGNVLVCDIERIKLTGIENSTLGLPSYYRSFLVQLGKKRIQNLNDVDIYGFGHILYELTENEPLTRPFCEHFSQKTSLNLTKQMKTILAPPSSKLLMPNVNLIITSLRHARMIEDQKDSAFFKYKIPASLKEFHIKIAEQCMSRIFEDQKKVALEKRHKKIYKIIHDPDQFSEATQSKHFEFHSIKSNSLLDNNRSHSSSSNSTLASNGSDILTNTITVNSTSLTSTPPLPPPPPPIASITPGQLSQPDNQRMALLDSISSFDSNKLKKVKK